MFLHRYVIRVDDIEFECGEYRTYGRCDLKDILPGYFVVLAHVEDDVEELLEQEVKEYLRCYDIHHEGIAEIDYECETDYDYE